MISDREIYLIDLGSSTVKLYSVKSKKCIILEKKSLWLKDGFSKNDGFSENKINELFSFFFEIIEKYGLTNSNTKIYATGVFRDLPRKNSFIELFFEKTGLYLNIISHELEAFYLENIWKKVHHNLQKDLLVINIGGKTTEIVACKDGISRTYKLDIGVASIQDKYILDCQLVDSLIYDDALKELSTTIKHVLDVDDVSIKHALYTGGELEYMNKAGYPLKVNSIFTDETHPSIISISEYQNKNADIFHNISLEELLSYYPENPQWMMGARPCSLLANAICCAFGVEYIIPSDANLIDGVIFQEARTVTICGSFNRLLDQIIDIKNKLEQNNITVLSPGNTEVVGKEGDFVVFKNDVIKNHNTWEIERLHLNAIDKCDFVIVCNQNNHIGVSTTFELRYAYEQGKKIVFIENNESANNFKSRWNLESFPSEIGLL